MRARLTASSAARSVRGRDACDAATAVESRASVVGADPRLGLVRVVIDEVISEAQVLAAMDPNGAVMKYGEIVGHIAGDVGVAPHVIYGEIGQILQRMRRAGSVALVRGRGRGAGWRRVLRDEGGG